VVHLRIVAPPDAAGQVLERLTASDAVVDIVHLPGVARRPDGDLILCDVAIEEASVVLSDLRALGIHRSGSISVDRVATSLSEHADRAERAAEGAPFDAVVWEEVLSTTTESARLSGSFLAFMILACLIGSAGIYLNSAITIVGAMVVGPEFGPIAALCVAIVSRRRSLAALSLRSLIVGFVVGIGVTYAVSLVFKATAVTPGTFSVSEHTLASVIASPDVLAFFIALCAGVAGMLSVTTSKAGQLIGVLISVTTIPAAANIAVSAAYRDGHALTGSARQLGMNLGALVLAGVVTLAVQRWAYLRRRARHRRELARDV
jgi:uncharacterized hydrophobic protein (TIGR00271 family)